jgi:concanavalin A-like lectin/glucanase superfamily protein/uncharacterized protein DUF2341
MKVSGCMFFFLFVAILHFPLSAQEFTKCKYRQQIELNTTPKGADVKGDVYNFPVAIILNDKNFDFSEANKNGSDLRFSKGKDTGLVAHSIEHWDKEKKTALIWVKVDFIKGNSTQNIFMHWGDVAAQAVSDSKAVFNTKEGFVAVWHLNEESDTTHGNYKDATANEAHGTGVNFKRDAAVDSRLGKGTLFVNTESRWIKIDGRERKLFDLTNKLTFSIWALAYRYVNKGDEVQRALPGYETMIAKGDNSWRLQKFGTRSWHNPPADLIEICIEEPPRADLCLVGKTDLLVNQWFHIVGVHDYPTIKLYVNGVLDNSDTLETNWKSDDHPVGIGNQSQFPEKGRGWDGILDEARVYNVPKDEHWIKLDYESQREGQRFTTFGKKEKKF